MRLPSFIKHSAVYGLGQVLARLASVLLLPFYTQHLTPADYGVVAIVDLTLQMLAILIGGGLLAAATRFHFDTDAPERQKAVWWTGLVLIASVATLIVAPALAFRHVIAAATLGSDVANGGYVWALGLATLWCNSLGQVGISYLVIRKWPALSVSLAFGSLLLNIGLNVYLIAGLGMGVEGLLLGNLIAAAASALVHVGILMAHIGAFRFDRALTVPLARFGGPLVATGLLGALMHQIDRVILLKYVDLGEVGIYSLAFTIGQGLNTLVLLPFSAVWDVTQYDIAKRADSRAMFALVFKYFVYGLLIILFGLSLFIGPAIQVLTPDDYRGVATLVPVICLSFVFFSLHAHFRVPAILAKKSTTMILPSALATAANIALNLVFVPRYGVVGAAWANVATYAIFSGVGLIQYRRIDRYDYPLLRCTAVLAGLVVSFAACQQLPQLGLPAGWVLALPLLVWAVWAIVLLRPLIRFVIQPASLVTAV